MSDDTVRVVGFNDEQTVCDRCGKVELRGTVIVADETAELGRYGTTCVATVLPAGHSRVTRESARRIEATRRDRVSEILRLARRGLDREGNYLWPRRDAVQLLRGTGRLRAIRPDEIAAAQKLYDDCKAARAAQAGRPGYAA